ncbi:MAG: methylated-DNA--[protein]-cysteine S-methyltransferase [Hydrogenophilus sp.]|nr:methylated-DNA--[protein]-cysteine S-methyltransferase [Hydrogenophilus sp.]
MTHLLSPTPSLSPADEEHMLFFPLPHPFTFVIVLQNETVVAAHFLESSSPSISSSSPFSDSSPLSPLSSGPLSFSPLPSSSLSLTPAEITLWDQLCAWLRDPRLPLQAPLALAGTPFQRRVWSHLQRIPPGQTRTYGQIAHQLAVHPRAVAAACRANPYPLFIPCHRVVGKNETLTGFVGRTTPSYLALKRWLLQREQLPFVDVLSL